MKLPQLSVFLENKPGQLKTACQKLAEANINILTLSLAETKKYGILRLIVQDWKRAQQVLEQSGFVVKETDVLAVEVAAQPGGLAGILEKAEKANLNVEYMYAFSMSSCDRAVLIFRFDDVDAAAQRLSDQGVNIIDSVDFYSKV